MTIDVRMLVKPSITLRDALQRLDSTGRGILLVIDDNNKLLRTVTDGDIRRLLLNGLTLDERLEVLPRQKPIIAYQDEEASVLLARMKQNEVNQVPVVNDIGEPVSVVDLKDIDDTILLSTPHMGGYESAYIEDAFRSNWIAPVGPNIDSFESEVADKVGVGYSVAVTSGTAAIHLALRVLGVGPGDYVFCSSFTFIASASPILYQRAEPVFIDSEPESWNMSPVALENAMADAKSKGRIPKAIVVANIYGQSADYDRILDICDYYGVAVVEDAAESLGANYKGRASGTLGRVGVFSFNGNKIITTSGGGMLISDNEDLVRKARHLSTQAKEPFPYYYHVELGYNYRMSNILAGIGRGQLKVLDERVAARRKIFKNYVDLLADVGGITWMPEREYGSSTRWLTAATIDPVVSRRDSKTIIKELNRQHIEARHVWKPLHTQPVFSGAKYYSHAKKESISEFLFNRGLCLPSSSHLSIRQQERVADALRNLIQ